MNEAVRQTSTTRDADNRTCVYPEVDVDDVLLGAEYAL